MVFGRRNKSNIDENEAYDPPHDASESHKSVFDDEEGQEPHNRTVDDDSSGSEANSDLDPASSSNKVLSPASGSMAAGIQTRRNMTFLFLFVLGTALGFFTVFGLGSRQQRNNNANDDVRSSSALADGMPTQSPLGSSPNDNDSNGNGGDLFVDTTAPPTTVMHSTIVPTLSPIGNEPSFPTTNTTPTETLVPTVQGSSNETMAPSSSNQTYVESTPTFAPTTNGLTTAPTLSPTKTTNLTMEPTLVPATTVIPTRSPTMIVSTSSPTQSLTIEPTSDPTSEPTTDPTSEPTTEPTWRPTAIPTQLPTTEPTQTGGTPSDNENNIVYGLQPDCYVQDDSKFNLCVDLSSPSGNVEDWFPLAVSAVQRWERVIAADPWGPWPPSMFTPISDNFIATERPTDTIDDMYLAFIVGRLDGRGGRFAEAGPDRVGSGGRVIAASILIDEADMQNVIDNGIFEQLMLHEILHCLGVGTLWSEGVHHEGTTYIGANGVQAWNDMGCTGPLPMANDLAHWNDDCFNTEVGTHYLRYRQPAHISSVTMGALEDLGYTVNREEEDAFGLSDLGNCGDSCPASDNVRMLRSTIPKLSTKAEQSLLEAAAERFRGFKKTVDSSKYEGGVVDSNVVSYLYEENGNYVSRVIHRHQVEHLI